MSARKGKDKVVATDDVDDVVVSAQSLDSSSLEARIVTIHLWSYTAVLVYLELYPVSRSSHLSSLNDIHYILTTQQCPKIQSTKIL